jgi:hypothetical protein
MWKQMRDVMAGLDSAIRVLNVSKKVVDAQVTEREDALRAFARA